MSGRFRPLVPALVALVATAAALASPSAVDSNGTVHSIETVVWADGPRVGGTAFRYVTQDADGEVRSEIVPGTDDLSVDREPSLALDPITERPILVWSRTEGDDHDIWLTRRDDAGWRERIPIAVGPGDQVEPKMSVRRELVHLVWTSDDGTGGATPYRLSLWRSSLDPAFGPEVLPRASSDMISPDGGVDPDAEASTSDLTYFASVLEDPATGEDSVVVWGIRDEPLPITYVQAFETQGATGDPRDAAAAWRGESLVTWFLAGGRLHYSVREDGVWTDLRVIVLDAGMDVGDALELIEQMILRNVEGALPD